MAGGSSNLVDQVRGKTAASVAYDLASEVTLAAVLDALENFSVTINAGTVELDVQPVVDAVNLTTTAVNSSITSFNSRTGDVVASPAANTVLARLKDIKTSIDTFATALGTGLATEATLAAFRTANNSNLVALKTSVDTLKTAFDARDLATQTTLAALKSEAHADSLAEQSALAGIDASADQTTAAVSAFNAAFTGRDLATNASLLGFKVENNSNLTDIKTLVNAEVAAIGTANSHLSTIKASLDTLDNWDETGRAKVNPIVGQAGIEGGAGASTPKTQRVVLASDVTPPLAAGAATEATLSAFKTQAHSNSGLEQTATTSVKTSVDAAKTSTDAALVAANASLDNIEASASALDDWDANDRAKVSPIAGQDGVEAGSGAVTALTQRVQLTDTNIASLRGTGAKTLSDIWDTLQGQRELSESIWTDDAGGYYFRRIVIDESVDPPTFTVSWTDSAGASSAGPGAGARPLDSVDRETVEQVFIATSAGTGYSVGDYIGRVIILDTSQSPPAVDAAIWVNITTGASISAPTGGTIEPSTELIGIKGRDGAAIASETNSLPVGPIVGQQGVTGGSGVITSATQRIAVATDDKVSTALDIMDDWDESDRAKVNPVVGQAGIEAGEGAATAKTTRVALTSEDKALLTGVDTSVDAVKTSVDALATQMAAEDFATETTLAAAKTSIDAALVAANASLDGIEASASVLDDWDESDRAKVNPIVGQAGVAAGTGADGPSVQRVSLATDIPLPAGANLLGKVSTDLTTPGTTNKVSTIAGQDGVQGGSGAVTALTQRVVLATDVVPPLALDAAKESTLQFRNNATATLINLLHLPTEKTLVDEVIGGHRYHGRALLATASNVSAWEVYRFARDASGNVIGPNSYLSGIKWDDRAIAGWP